METITVAATAEHSVGLSTLALLGVSLIVVALVAWQLIARMRPSDGSND
jgi:hypothetical protein